MPWRLRELRSYLCSGVKTNALEVKGVKTNALKVKGVKELSLFRS